MNANTGRGPHMVPILLNRGLVYLAKKEHNHALESLMRAHRLAESVLGVNRLDVACVSHNLGVVHDRLNNVNEAQEFYAKALTIREKVLGKDDPNTMATYHNLSELLIQSRRYKQALPILIRLTRAVGMESGDKSLEFAKQCYDTGLVCVELGKTKRGFKYLRWSHSIREVLLPRNHADTLAVLVAIRPLIMEEVQCHDIVTSDVH